MTALPSSSSELRSLVPATIVFNELFGRLVQNPWAMFGVWRRAAVKLELKNEAAQTGSLSR